MTVRKIASLFAIAALAIPSGSVVANASGKVTLYYSNGACSLASRIVINQLAVPAEFESVDLKSHKTQSGKDFYTINSKGSVPTLKLENGQVLTENAAIMQYLADTYKPGEMLPATTDFDRYKVLEAVNYISTELHKGFAPMFHSKLSDDAKAQFVDNLKKKLDYVSNQIGAKQFLVGNKFSIADAYLVTVLNWLPYAKLDIAKWKNLKIYRDNLIKNQKSVSQSMQQEGLL